MVIHPQSKILETSSHQHNCSQHLQVDGRLLSGFSEGDVTYNSIKPFDDQKSIGGPNFSFLDDRKEDIHLVGSVDCTETVSFIVGLRNPKGDSQVYLEQDEHKNGWTLTYC
ncbi:hypothetical protein FVEG_08839 [Fusarium verticillioides 7600]|uniref:Uncharacterized protein n=1 Tax=Gibberella moniliformis (strain M3125 / FGSC 7600) TaxID=334819 RepID=W7MY12_GIBM7|nr:hypothetical protein FVEG_08839 [Fusarium verticillioides 7600]EWG49262.1 hypothetical protein FVEG_08839 [Fusarium verticillioides 7600]